MSVESFDGDPAELLRLLQLILHRVMSKRKRGEWDYSGGEERHAKIRVQEIDNTSTSGQQDGDSRPMGASPPTEPQTSHAQQDDAIRKATRKKAKQERRALKKAEKNSNRHVDEAVIQENGGDAAAKIQEPRREQYGNTSRSLVKGHSSEQKGGRKLGAKDARTRTRRKPLALRSKWTMLDPVGGRMLDLDPIFARDELHLLVAYGTFVAVYSTTTSLLIRRLPLQKPGVITGMILDPLVDGTIYVSTSQQDLSKWDWKEGQRLNAWHVAASIQVLAAACQTLNPEADDIVYTIERGAASQWSMSAHRLLETGGKTEATTQTLLKFEDRLTGLQVLHGGKMLVATAGQKLILGTTKTLAPEDISGMKYVWRVVDCPEWITSFDVRSRPSSRTSKKHISKGGLLEAIDVAVGGLKGTVRLYEDLYQRLLRKENAAKAASLENVVSRNLHWHRNAVMTVKWSLDGKRPSTV